MWCSTWEPDHPTDDTGESGETAVSDAFRKESQGATRAEDGVEGYGTGDGSHYNKEEKTASGRSGTKAKK